MGLLNRIFKLQENNTSIRKEIYSGTITFLAVAYILAVNPSILSCTGMPRGGLFFVTALAAFAGTLTMALLANSPLALAPAMGLSAFFAFSVVNNMGYSWQLALAAITLEGIVFFGLSISSIREKIVNTIPLPLKYAMGAGIGLFITLIAFKSAHFIKAHPATLLTIQDFFGKDFHTAGISALLAFFGLLLSSFLMHRNVPGTLLWGILCTWGAGIICQLTGIYHADPANGFYSLLPSFSVTSFTQSLGEFCTLFGAAFDTDKWACASSDVTGIKLILSADFLIVCFAFLFTDFFDTVGSVNGAMVNTPLMNSKGEIPKLKRILLADSIATFIGGVLGTSTTTTFVESTIGIRIGARTGLAALTCALLFLLSLICAPIFLAIPGFATAPALIIVGFLMMKTGINIDWNDVAEAIPAYILITATVFTYSISDGLGFGVISYSILNCWRKGKVHWILWLISLLFVAKYLCL